MGKPQGRKALLDDQNSLTSKGSILRVVELLKKYRVSPMDLRNASLVVLAEEQEVLDIISIDSDADVYRVLKKENFHNLCRQYLAKVSDY